MSNLIKSTLYQYTVLWHPTKSQSEDGKSTKIITPLSTEMAKNDDSLFRKLLRNIPDKYSEELDQIDIVIRPF